MRDLDDCYGENECVFCDGLRDDSLEMKELFRILKSLSARL